MKADFCPTLASFGPVCPGIALLLVHCLAARPLLPAYDLGDGAKPQENRQSMLVAFLHQLWQDGAAMNESEKQFSFTRAASSTSGAAKSKFLSKQERLILGMRRRSSAYAHVRPFSHVLLPVIPQSRCPKGLGVDLRKSTQVNCFRKSGS